ncbi:MAG: hypothetical protein AABM66_14795 [Actinomycetota bacterium]
MRKLSPSEERHPAIVALRREVEARQNRALTRLRENFGVHINFVAPVEFEGGKLWALGDRVYFGRPPNETFHEFLLSILRETLGERWRAERAAREDKHFLMRCFEEYREWIRQLSETTEPTDGVWDAPPNGWAQYLRAVAWDVATLVHACPGGLPDGLVDRMRDPVAFQGARYELAVAALFARLDCEIEFLDEVEELRGKSRPEFIARHRPTEQRIAVEAKSRHRAGVLNEEGEPNEGDPLSGDARAVRALFVKALKKDIGGLPYLIFIDINAPADRERDGFDKEWAQDVRRWMARFDKPTAQNPDGYNGLFVTNFAPHYQGDDLASPGEWFCALPIYTVAPLGLDFLGMVGYALDRYDRVPEIGLDGEVR